MARFDSYKKDSYKEIGFLKPKFNKYRRLGFNLKYMLYRLNWHLVEKLHYVTRFPIHIDFETTNFCNLKCIMCPQSIEGAVKDKGYMDFALFKKIIDEGSKEGLKSIKMNIRGEPLLHPDLAKMVAYAKQKGVLEVMLNTNGQLLDSAMAGVLVDAGLDYIIFSIDGATKETYETIRKGADFKRLLDNVNYLLEYRKARNLKKPIIRIQFIKMKENIAEVSAFYEIWKNKADIMAANDYSNRTDCSGRSTRDKSAVGRANCPHPWRRLSVSWNGKAMICCSDWQMKNVVGDCNEQSVKAIWKSSGFDDIRRLLLKKELEKIPGCRDCFCLGSYVWKNKK